MIEFLVSLIWYILPAYATNSSAVIFAGKSPMDSGAKFLDGRRVLGEGKTWKGFFGAVAVGCLVGVFQSFFAPDMTQRILIGVFVSVGAMFGDALGSFVKRRLALESGEAAPFLDQWDFLFGAFLIHWVGHFFVDIPFPELGVLLGVLVLTPFLHILTNWGAYKVGLKSNPW